MVTGQRVAEEAYGTHIWMDSGSSPDARDNVYQLPLNW